MRNEDGRVALELELEELATTAHHYKWTGPLQWTGTYVSSYNTEENYRVVSIAQGKDCETTMMKSTKPDDSYLP